MTTQTPTVFVVDDDDAVRGGLQRLLTSAGYRCEAFASAESFLASYTAARPGCVLLDVRMPGMSGLELQRVLNDQDMRIPIIMLTGHGSIPLAVTATRAGAIEFLEKPPDPEVLIQRVREGLLRDQRRREIEADIEYAATVMAGFTRNERELVNRLLSGQSVEKIAIDLGLPPATIIAKRDLTMRQLGANGFATLTRAVARGFKIHTL